jgi:sec-independent protein translocase protein TatB
MSLGEMLVLGVVAIVVVGPRNLPSMLRNAGQLIGRLRKMAAEIRAESGIDEILEVEGIRSEIDHFRKLATGQIDPDAPLVVPDRDREYPRTGPDVYGAESEDLDPYLTPEEIAARDAAAREVAAAGIPASDLASSDTAAPAEPASEAASGAAPADGAALAPSAEPAPTGEKAAAASAEIPNADEVKASSG